MDPPWIGNLYRMIDPTRPHVQKLFYLHPQQMFKTMLQRFKAATTDITRLNYQIAKFLYYVLCYNDDTYGQQLIRGILRGN